MAKSRPKFRVEFLHKNVWRGQNSGDRFWSLVNRPAPHDCWIWLGGKTDGGYGRFWACGRSWKAHVISYAILIGIDVPEGQELDHTCKNPSCVNPRHLEPVSHKINVLRGSAPTAINARRRTCVSGHDLSGQNLYLYKGKHRHCKICRAARLREYRRANAKG